MKRVGYGVFGLVSAITMAGMLSSKIHGTFVHGTAGFIVLETLFGIFAVVGVSGAFTTWK